MITLLILALPYLSILAWSAAKRQIGMGIVGCLALMIFELVVALHLWLAFAV